jgi:hypothetical protein
MRKTDQRTLRRIDGVDRYNITKDTYSYTVEEFWKSDGIVKEQKLWREK